MDIKLKNTKSEIKIPWINLVVNWILQKKASMTLKMAQQKFSKLLNMKKKMLEIKTNEAPVT